MYVRVKGTVTIIAMAAVVGTLHAQRSEDFELRIVPAANGPVCTTGGTVELSVVLTSTVPFEGWSFGMILQPGGGVSASITEIRIGPDVLTSWNGQPPNYMLTRYFAAEDVIMPAGWCDELDPTLCQRLEARALNQAVLLQLGGGYELPPVENLTLLTLKVAVAAPLLADGETAKVGVRFSEATGSPPMGVTVIAGGNRSFPPHVQAPAVITIGNSACPPSGAATDMRILPPATGQVDYRGVTADFAVSLQTRLDGLEAWSFGVKLERHPGVEALITDIHNGEDLLTVQDGAPPDFLMTYLPRRRLSRETVRSRDLLLLRRDRRRGRDTGRRAGLGQACFVASNRGSLGPDPHRPCRRAESRPAREYAGTACFQPRSWHTARKYGHERRWPVPDARHTSASRYHAA